MCLNIDLILNIWGVAIKFADVSKSFKGSLFSSFYAVCASTWFQPTHWRLENTWNQERTFGMHIYWKCADLHFVFYIQSHWLIHPNSLICLYWSTYIVDVSYILRPRPRLSYIQKWVEPKLKLVTRSKILTSIKLAALKG